MTDKELQEKLEAARAEERDRVIKKIAKSLHAQYVSVKVIANATDLTVEEVKEILGLGPKKMEEIMSLEEFCKTALGKKMYEEASKSAWEKTKTEEYQNELKEFLDRHNKKHPSIRKEWEWISNNEYVRGYAEGYIKTAICVLHRVAKIKPDYLEEMGEILDLTMDEVNEILKLPQEFVDRLQRERDEERESIEQKRRTLQNLKSQLSVKG